MSKLLRLSEQRGSNLLTYTMIGIGTGIGFFNFTIHSFALDQYAGLFRLHQDGFEADVPEDLNVMLSQVSEDLCIPIRNPVTKLLAVIGFEPMNFGSTLLDSGSIIGVPVSFFYKSKSDIDQSSILIENKTVPWYSPDGKKFEESLVMSDSAKKFGIGYELACADTSKVILHTFCAPFSVLICAQINNYFCNVFGLPYRPVALKGVFYSLLTVFGAGVYYTLKDMSTQYCELNALDKVSEGGKDYITGGIEYFEKMLLKHKSLRNLLADGSSDYNSNGDPIYFFRRKHVPPTVLKSSLEEKLNQSKQTNVLLDNVA